MMTGFGRPNFKPAELFPIALIVLLVIMLIDASGWEYDAKIVPMVVGWSTVAIAAVSLANQVFRLPSLARAESEASIEGEAKKEIAQKVRLDFEADVSHLTTNEVLRRAAIFFGWFVLFLISMSVIGLIPTVPFFTIAYMRSERREPWKLTLIMAVCLTLFVYVVFDWTLMVPWPRTLIGDLFPMLKVIPSV